MNFPTDPDLVSLELAEQLLGLRPRPRLHYLSPKPRPVAGGGVAGPGGVVAPGPVPAGTPNADAAKVWAGRALEPKAMGRALARLGVQVASDPKTATARPDGALFLNYIPSGEEMWDNATLNEELWHLTGLMTLKSEWEE